MSAYLDHVAVNTAQYEETLHFYESVFGMTISRTAGDKPHRKVWLQQGIQINEVCTTVQEDCLYDHIALRVENLSETLKNAQLFGCKQIEGKPNWIITPENLVIELFG